MKKLREKVLEAAKIAEECPENLQAICFELLMKHLLGMAPQAPSPAPGVTDASSRDEQKDKGAKRIIKKDTEKQDDLLDSDLHVRVKRFLNKYGLTIDSLNQVFYKQNSEILPLYDDLKTTRTSENQVRITFLQCLRTAIRTGEFETPVEEVKAEAKVRKCYEVNNWGNNFTNNSRFFDFDSYSRDIESIKLSEEGKAELANLIKELE